MAQKIEKKITGYKVTTPEPQEPVQDFIKEHMHEGVSRPDRLLGATYKIKTPDSEHSMYITINNVVLNEGTEYEELRPYEIFINSKNMEQYQWIVALTRVMSAVFRKGGDVAFLIDELKSVFDPKGGYFKRGSYMPSLIAEIGNVLKDHLMSIGLITREELPTHIKKYIESKKKEHEDSRMQMCNKCHEKAVIFMDGCMTCTNCGDSKCG